MRFVSLTVKNFRGIVESSVEFGPGLNVLFGPNDLGKSTLAEALRAVLLLQDSSSEAKAYVPWNRGVVPSVTLVFEDEVKRYWRVKKDFGSGRDTESTLDWSNDGRVFANDCRGREVDQKLREILKWGVPSPGGQSRTRGMPESFLATALLAGQTEVDTILTETLDEDDDDSGRLSIKAALSILAEDPRVRRVIDEAQAERDRFFTTTGRPRTGRNSPFTGIAERVTQARDQVSELEQKMASARSAEGDLREIEEQIAAAVKERDKAEEHLAQLRQDFEKQNARDAAEPLVKAARTALQTALTVEESIRQREKQVLELDVKVREHGEAEQAASASLDEARQHVKVAEENLKSLESQDGNAQRTIEVSRTEKRIAEIVGAFGKLEVERQKAQDALARLSALEVARKAAESALEAYRNAEVALQTATTEAATAEGDLAALDAIIEFEKLDEAIRTLEQKRVAGAEVDRLTRLAASRKIEIADAEKAHLALAAPDRATLAMVRALFHEKEMATARTAAGLEVSIERHAAFALRLQRDAESPTEMPSALGVVASEAQRTIAFQLGDLATVNIAAGTAEARAALRDLERRWAEKGQPILDRMAATNVEGLERVVEHAEGKAKALAVLKQDLATIESSLANANANAVGLAEAEQAVLEKRAVIEAMGEGETPDTQRARHQKRLTAHFSVSNPAQISRAKLLATLKTQEELRQETQVSVASLRTMLDERDANLRTAEDAARLVSREYSMPPVDILRALEVKSTELRQEEDTLKRRIADLANSQESTLLAAQESIRDAKVVEEKAKGVFDAAREQAAKASGELTALQGALAAEREQLQRLNLPALQATMTKEQTAFDALPLPTEAVDKHRLTAGEQLFESARTTLARLEREREGRRGALSETGGLVVAEKLERAEEVRDGFIEEQAAIEADAAASKLLLEVLLEAQKSTSTHVGAHLAKPVEGRFAQLTNGRYSSLKLNPALKTESIGVAGGQHDPTELSVGTREQLATLLRLVIAEQLGAPIVLDDHLVQTDPGRLEWFSKALRQAATKTQVIVLTCRARDYLTDADCPPAGEHYADRAGGVLRATNLGLIVKRWQPESARSDGTTST